MTTVLDLPTPDPRTLDEPGRSLALALADRYSIKRIVGRGGMGIVYLGRDKRLERPVAIKVLPPQLESDPEIRERFLREARMAAGMAHPNIVPVYGADEIDGHVYFVMSYVQGESLAAHVQALGPLDPRRVVEYMHDVASALVHAHGRGIIHRDIKAENILIERENNRAVVTDFGIARAAAAAPTTATGQVLGTVYYVSPEQVTGDAVDGRSDLYSLGVVGYFALTGTFPFDATLASAVLVAHVTRNPPPVGSVAPGAPSALTTIIDRCLAKSPAHRFASAAELMRALDAARPEVERHAAGKPLPRLISDTEARTIWKRAAELQAQTGVHPRPAPVSIERDRARDAALTYGFKLDEVRAAAGEAGIAGQYVEHAMVERGLAMPSHRSGVSTNTTIPREVGPVLGSGWLTFERAVVVEGELPTRGFDALLAYARSETGSSGVILADSRELVWARQASHLDELHLSVAPDRGRTTIKVSARASYAVASALVIAGPLTAALLVLPVAVVDRLMALPGEEFLWGLLSAGSTLGGLVIAWRRVRETKQRVLKLSEGLAERIRIALDK